MFASPQPIRYQGKLATYYAHSLSRSTIFQSIVLGLLGGPLVALMTGQGFLWCSCAMAAAPWVVDAMKPTIVIERPSA